MHREHQVLGPGLGQSPGQRPVGDQVPEPAEAVGSEIDLVAPGRRASVDGGCTSREYRLTGVPTGPWSQATVFGLDLDSENVV